MSEHDTVLGFTFGSAVQITQFPMRYHQWLNLSIMILLDCEVETTLYFYYFQAYLVVLFK